MSKIISVLQRAIRSAAVYSQEVQVAPVCILWPDRERQWAAAIFLPGAETGEHLYPRFWNPSQQIALADGVSCFGEQKTRQDNCREPDKVIDISLSIEPRNLNDRCLFMSV